MRRSRRPLRRRSRRTRPRPTNMAAVVGSICWCAIASRRAARAPSRPGSACVVEPGGIEGGEGRPSPRSTSSASSSIVAPAVTTSWRREPGAAGEQRHEGLVLGGVEAAQPHGRARAAVPDPAPQPRRRAGCRTRRVRTPSRAAAVRRRRRRGHGTRRRPGARPPRAVSPRTPSSARLPATAPSRRAARRRTGHEPDRGSRDERDQDRGRCADRRGVAHDRRAEHARGGGSSVRRSAPA